MSSIGKIFSPNRSENGSWLAVLRIGVSSILIAKIISEFRYLNELYGSSGLIPEALGKFSQLSLIPTLQGVYHLFTGMWSETLFLHVFFLCQLGFGFFLLLGYKSRLNAALCWGMQVIVFNSSHLLSYGFDAVLLSLLFYAMIFPVGNYWSADKSFGAKQMQSDESMVPYYLKTMQLHLCLIYFANGVSKMSGPSWHDGSGLWDAINQPQFECYLTPLLQKLFMIKHVPALITWSTITLEIAYSLLIWVKKVNKLILAGIILLHVSIAMVFGLWLFGGTMILFNLVAFGKVLWTKKENPLP
jgi:Vitamin K-dependent gamma-carboxylase